MFGRLGPHYCCLVPKDLYLPAPPHTHTEKEIPYPGCTWSPSPYLI